MQFVAVGSLGFVLNMGVFYISHTRLQIHYNLSAILSFMVAVSQNFVLNNMWTFRDRGLSLSFKNYYKYVFSNLLGLGCNLFVLDFFVRVIHVVPELSQVVGVCAGTGISWGAPLGWTDGVKI